MGHRQAVRTLLIQSKANLSSPLVTEVSIDSPQQAAEARMQEV